MKTFLLSLLTLFFCNNASAVGGSITNNRYNNSLIGGTGSLSPSFSPAYGQLYFSSQEEINFSTANTFVAIPFNAFGVSSNLDGSTTSPATITIKHAGVYEINTSLYFSSEDSPEIGFTATTYTVGIRVNGGSTVSNAAIPVPDPGFYTLNHSTIMEFSANDVIQFYMKSSNLSGSGFAFDNIVTLLNGNATLVQIAN